MSNNKLTEFDRELLKISEEDEQAGLVSAEARAAEKAVRYIDELEARGKDTTRGFLKYEIIDGEGLVISPDGEFCLSSEVGVTIARLEEENENLRAEVRGLLRKIQAAHSEAALRGEPFDLEISELNKKENL